MSGLKLVVHDNITARLIKKLGAAAPRAEHALAIEVMKDTNQFVPALTLSFANRTQVFGNTIVYPGPYARYLYYGKVMVDEATGKGPMRIVLKDGSQIIRFRKGATLKPTSRPLKYNRSVHPQATGHWFEASKARNLKKWEQAAGRLMSGGLGK